MFQFRYLVKTEFDKYAKGLFGILAKNMMKIAPTGNRYEEDYVSWYSAVSEGLKADKRKIILISMKNTEDIIGFFQYYTNEEVFMMEELQIEPIYQGKNNIFRTLYGFVLNNIDKNIPYVEAYANKKNDKSIGILNRLGLSVIGVNKSGKSFHFRGTYADLMRWYESHSGL